MVLCAAAVHLGARLLTAFRLKLMLYLYVWSRYSFSCPCFRTRSHRIASRFAKRQYSKPASSKQPFQAQLAISYLKHCFEKMGHH
jgi:hypothetical protein